MAEDRGSRPATSWTRRSVRLLVALVLGALAVGGLAAPGAAAATGRVLVTLTDPLSIDPVRLDVAAVGADGWAAPFTGTVTLSSGSTSTRVPIAGPDGQAAVSVPTTTLKGGPVRATVVLRAGGRTMTTTVRGIVVLPSMVEIRGFGCDVLTPAQPRLAWQVVRLNGVPVEHPAWTPPASGYPAYVRTVRPATIADSQGHPVSTKGSVTIARGGTTVARIAMKPAVRRLLFSTPWAGTVKGRFTPGAYTATLRLTDAFGRVVTAVQPVVVARSSVGRCS